MFFTAPVDTLISDPYLDAVLYDTSMSALGYALYETAHGEGLNQLTPALQAEAQLILRVDPHESAPFVITPSALVSPADSTGTPTRAPFSPFSVIPTPGGVIKVQPPLVLSVSSPTQNESFAVCNIPITGSAGGAPISAVTLSIDGESAVTASLTAAAIPGDPNRVTFNQPLTGVTGGNTVTITATDQANATVSQTIQVTCQTAPCTPLCNGTQCGDGCGGLCPQGCDAMPAPGACQLPAACDSSGACSYPAEAVGSPCNSVGVCALDGSSLICATPPTANAGPAQNICLAANATSVSGTLSGSGADSNNPVLSLTYSWVETDTPALATLSNASSASATFTAAAPFSAPSETLQFALTTTNAAGLASPPSTTQVTLWQPTAPPVINLRAGHGPQGSTPPLGAIASGATVSVLSNQAVVLDASGSTDAQGSISYQWTSSNSGALSLSGTNSATLTFVTPPPLPDDSSGPLTYQFILTATATPPSGDDCGPSSSTAVVNVIVDEPPVAIGKVEQTGMCGYSMQGAVCGGQKVTLDGSGSTDPNGSGLVSYVWTQLPNSQLTTPIGPLSGEFVSFTAPDLASPTTLVFALVVTDALGLQSINPNDTVSVTVKAENEVPIADAGNDQTVMQGATVALSSAGSYDPDGNPITYLWTQTGGPSVCLSGAPGCSSASTQANPTFKAPQLSQCGDAKSQTLTFRLTVTDQPSSSQCGGPLTSPPATVTITVEEPDHPPVANAGCAQTVNDGALVQLDGSQSYDPDGDLLTYQWKQLSGPAVSLSNASAVKPTFIAPAVAVGSSATLTFQLTVTDPDGLSSSAQVTITDRGVSAPPDCSKAYPSVTQLWPPSHEMVDVQILGVKDPNDSNLKIAITSIQQDEPTTGTSAGDTPIDAVINSDGSCLLRAERGDSSGNRTYYVNFEATDQHGNCCNGQVTVGVPQGNGGSCSPRGPLYNSCQ